MAVIRLCEPLAKKSLWISVLAEFIGTFLLVVLGVATIYINASHENEKFVPHSVRVILSSAGFGIAVAGLVFAIGFGFPHGSAHFNPAFTLGCLVLDKVTVVRGLLFWCAQIIGGIAGGAFLYGCYSSMQPNVFACTTLSGVEPIQGFALELIGTFVLVFGILAVVAVCERHNYGAAVVATAVCIIIAIVIIIIGPYTGASINPARSLGPAIFFGGKCWTNHWVYWAGPLAGGLLGGALVRILLYNDDETEQKEKRQHASEVTEMHETRKLVVTTNA